MSLTTLCVALGAPSEQDFEQLTTLSAVPHVVDGPGMVATFGAPDVASARVAAGVRELARDR